MSSSSPRTKKLDIRAVVLLALIAFVALSRPTTSVQAATSSNLSVTISKIVVMASANSTLLLEISNVGKNIRELDVELTVPMPLVLFGDNHWIRSWFAHGDTILANLTIFAPSSAAGTTVQSSIVATYKVIGETIPSTETHAISFLIRGWIDMATYEITVSPDPALPGSEITISGNLLNRGVIPAMYVNVTVAADPPLVGDSVKPTYVGEVDPNAPAPFSVTATVDSGATAGSYQASVLVYYRDDLQLDRAFTIPVSFTIVAELPKTETTKTGIIDQLLSNPGQLLSNPGALLSNGVVVLGLVALIVLLAIIIYIRRRRRQTPET